MSSSEIFRARKDLVIMVFHGGDEDEPFICAVNGECTVDKLAEIEEWLMGEEHEFSSGPGEYVYLAAYDEGQFDEIGNCENLPYWELTEISFTAPDWMNMTHEPHTFPCEPEPCQNCGLLVCATDICIPY